MVYLSAVEEGTRANATELARPPRKLPWSTALLTAMEVKASLWVKNRSILQDKHQMARDEWRKPPITPFQQVTTVPNFVDSDKKGLGKGKNGDKGKKGHPWATAKQTSDGKAVCFKFNGGGGGCVNQSCKFAHVCDIRVQAGHACGGKHPRKDHDANKHGKPFGSN